MFFVRWGFSFEIASENCLFKKNLDKIINLICLINFGEVFREFFLNWYFFPVNFYHQFPHHTAHNTFLRNLNLFRPTRFDSKNSHKQKSQFIILLIFPFTWSCVTLTESCVRWYIMMDIEKKEGSKRCSSQFYSHFSTMLKISKKKASIFLSEHQEIEKLKLTFFPSQLPSEYCCWQNKKSFTIRYHNFSWVNMKSFSMEWNYASLNIHFPRYTKKLMKTSSNSIHLVFPPLISLHSIYSL